MAKKRKIPAIHKPSIKLIKLTSLSKVELSKINLQDVWLMKPKVPGRERVSVRYCRCRSVCYV